MYVYICVCVCVCVCVVCVCGLFLVHVFVSGGPPVVSSIRVKDRESAMNDESTRDTLFLLITPNPTRLVIESCMCINDVYYMT